MLGDETGCNSMKGNEMVIWIYALQFVGRGVSIVCASIYMYVHNLLPRDSLPVEASHRLDGDT